MLVRKFLRPKLTEVAEHIIYQLEFEDPDYKDFIYLTSEEKEIIKQSLYKTEITWEMEL